MTDPSEANCAAEDPSEGHEDSGQEIFDDNVIEEPMSQDEYNEYGGDGDDDMYDGIPEEVGFE